MKDFAADLIDEIYSKMEDAMFDAIKNSNGFSREDIEKEIEKVEKDITVEDCVSTLKVLRAFRKTTVKGGE